MIIDPTRDYLFARRRKTEPGLEVDGIAYLKLHSGGALTGSRHPNESQWRAPKEDVIEFLNPGGEVTTRFDTAFSDRGLVGISGEFKKTSEGEAPVTHVLAPMMRAVEAQDASMLGILVASNVHFYESTLPLLLESLDAACVPRDRVLVVIAQAPREDDGVIGEFMGYRTIRTFQDSWEYSAMAAVSRYPGFMPSTKYLFTLHDTSQVFADFWGIINSGFTVDSDIDIIVRDRFCSYTAFRKQFLVESGSYWQSLHGVSKDAGLRVEMGRPYCKDVSFRSGVWSPDRHRGESHRAVWNNPDARVTPYPGKASRIRRRFPNLGLVKFSRGNFDNDSSLGDTSKADETGAAIQSLVAAGWLLEVNKENLIVLRKP